MRRRRKSLSQLKQQERERIVKQFAEITQCTADLAIYYLEQSQYSLESALENFGSDVALVQKQENLRESSPFKPSDNISQKSHILLEPEDDYSTVLSSSPIVKPLNRSAQGRLLEFHDSIFDL